MKKAQKNLKSQKNTSGTLPGSSQVGGADCSRIIGGSAPERTDFMVETWLASKPSTGATFRGGLAQEGSDSKVETWLASKPTTTATFRSESLPCTSYPLARSMSSSSADIDMKTQHDFSANKFLPGTSLQTETILVILISDFEIRD